MLDAPSSKRGRERTAKFISCYGQYNHKRSYAALASVKMAMENDSGCLLPGVVWVMFLWC